ncbi:MAG: hypothetical protein K6A67_10890 [Bacteroidales bacterium]|nr:hypothetical protein [Bacteroidales bacterium]
MPQPRTPSTFACAHLSTYRCPPCNVHSRRVKAVHGGLQHDGCDRPNRLNSTMFDYSRFSQPKTRSKCAMMNAVQSLIVQCRQAFHHRKRNVAYHHTFA